MVKQWVQPPINRHRMVPGVFFFLGSHLTSFTIFPRFSLEYCSKGESFEIQFLAIFYIEFNKGFNQICFFIFILKVFI